MHIREWRRSRWRPRRHWGHVLGQRETWGYLTGRLDSRLTLRYVPWAGYVLVGVEWSAGGHRHTHDYLHWEIKTMMRRTAAPSPDGGKGKHLASQTSPLFSQHGALIQQLTVTRYDDGEVRQPGSLFISTQGSMWKVTVTEPDPCLKLTIIAQTLDDALAALTLALEAESIPWEIDTYAMSRKPRPKK